MMTELFAKQALLENVWNKDVRVTVEAGRIASIATNTARQAADVSVDTLLPALSNLHSHTFQRAMAGMTEKRGPTTDSFWTWRELMYRFLQHLTPEDIENIAAFAFMEMQEAGFAAVAEFHYIHHATGGAHYANRAELSARIMAASKTTGIGLTLLPVLYSQAGLGEKPLAENQRRFGNTLQEFEVLHDEAKSQLAKTLPADARLGAAPHSLRAATLEDINTLASQAPEAPLHLHIAEQLAEVDEVKAATGATPVEWLLANANVGSNWCLIHATHMTAAETSRLAKTGAVAGLCPITEANLGDGIFNAVEFMNASGRCGIGTDSNINITLQGELAMLEYSQRLHKRQRNVLSKDNASTGANLYMSAAKGGAQALGRNSGAIATGNWADLVAIDSTHIQLCALQQDQLLDGWIFATNAPVITDSWSAGRHCVAQGRHVNRDPITQAYRQTVQRLASLL